MSTAKKTNRELRKFGLTLAAGFLVVAALFFWRDVAAWPYLLGISGLFALFGLVLPRVLAPIEWAWMKFAGVMGYIMTRVLLTLTFFLAITPTALILRLFGKDPLQKRIDSSASTFWIEVEEDGPTSRPDKPY
jgi:hypothetical protein